MNQYCRTLIVSESNGHARIEHKVSAPDKKTFDHYVDGLKKSGYIVRPLKGVKR